MVSTTTGIVTVALVERTTDGQVGVFARADVEVTRNVEALVVGVVEESRVNQIGLGIGESRRLVGTEALTRQSQRVLLNVVLPFVGGVVETYCGE